ncbi:hypothetical protein ACVWZZ_005586 [Bradyrhizobium sp. LM6.10]
MMLPAGKPQKEGNSRGPAYGDNIKDLRQEMWVEQAQKRTSILYVHAPHPLVCGICCEVSKAVVNIVHRYHRDRRFRRRDCRARTARRPRQTPWRQ